MQFQAPIFLTFAALQQKRLHESMGASRSGHRSEGQGIFMRRRAFFWRRQGQILHTVPRNHAGPSVALAHDFTPVKSSGL